MVIVNLERQNKALHDEILYAECYSQSENLHFNGIHEELHEDVEAKVV